VSVTDEVRSSERGSTPERGSGGTDAPVGDRPAGYDRTPPQDNAAEQCVLGGMLLSKDAIADVVEILRSGDFYRPQHSTIFDAVVDLYGRGEPADPITVAAALADSGALARVGGANYLHTLIASVPTAANASYYARIVAERAVLRRLVEAGTRIVQLGYGAAAGQGRDTDEIVDLAQQAVYDVTERRVSEDFAVLADLLQPTLDEIDAIGARGDAMTGVPTGFADLDRLLNGLHPGQLVIVAGRPGLGKALALDTPLPTPDGWTTMGDVRIGDRLLGADGRTTTVIALSDIMIDRPCYEVEFSDGSVIVADGSHRWLTHTRASRRGTGHPAVRTTEQILATLRTETADRRANHSVALTRALELPDVDLPVAPYTFGVWLGDGHSDAARFTTDDPEMVAYVEADGYFAPRDGPRAYAIKRAPLPPLPDRACAVCGKQFSPKSPVVRTCGRVCGGGSAHKMGPSPQHRCEVCDGPIPGRGAAARRCAACHSRSGSVSGALRGMGVLGNKHIPTAYLRASETQRRALLAGLLDTDGTVAPSGNVQFCVTSRRLAESVRELIISLGYRCSLTTRRVKGRHEDSSTAYTLNLSTSDELFRLERKKVAHKERSRSWGGVRNKLRYIVDVRAVASVAVRCVSVDNADHLFLAGRSMIPTHNSTASMDFARNAAVRHNLASAIFSLEMSKVEIVMRLLSAEARVPLHVLRSGQLADDDWTKLARRMGEISGAPLFIDDTPNMTLMEIRAKARRLRQRHDLKLVVVDYLQLMTSPRRVESRQQEVAELSRGLKLLAKEIECPVIAVSQLNRGPEQRTDKRPQLSDLRESGSIEQDADVVILLHRDDYYDRESPRAGEADFIVAKHRNGPTDTVTVAAQLHLSRFVDMAI
jgi:replicative DNA helicase